MNNNMKKKILIVLSIIAGLVIISVGVNYYIKNTNKPIVYNVNYIAPNGKERNGYGVKFKTEPDLEYRVILRNKLLPYFGDEEKNANYDSGAINKYLIKTTPENILPIDGAGEQPLFFTDYIPVGGFLSNVRSVQSTYLKFYKDNNDKIVSGEWLLEVPEERREQAQKEFTEFMEKVKKYENYKTDVNLSDLAKSFYVEVQKIKDEKVIDIIYSDLFEIDRKFCNADQLIWNHNCNSVPEKPYDKGSYEW